MRALLTYGLLLVPLSLLAQQDQPTSLGKGSILVQHHRTFRAPTAETLNENLAPFYHGVASGDPQEDRVIIWTRVTPPEMNNTPVEVDWRMATDPTLQDIVASGSFTTDAARDYTVKVDVTGLAPGTTYYYGFTALGKHSLTGKTKTTPVADFTDHLKFGVVSCSNYQAGFFNAYGTLAARTDLDAVIHLGDYIYEYANAEYGSDSVLNERQVEPAGEIISLFDYRTRYSTYRLDTNLLRLHQQHPMIAVWDDHETANDSWRDGAQNHQADEGDWNERKAQARQAYFEWMPLRESARNRVYRSISYGEIADLILLDTRLEGREEQIRSVTDTALFVEARTLLGSEQRDWFFDRLRNSTARWKLIGQQVLFSEFNVGWAGRITGDSFEATESLFLDVWDGYPAERQRVVNFIKDNSIDNVVILTGDFHSSFANDVAQPPVDRTFIEVAPEGRQPLYEINANYDPASGAGSVAVEFATPSISSANFDENVGIINALGFQFQMNQPLVVAGTNLGTPNSHMKYVDLTRHGYFLLDVTPGRVQADFFYTDILEENREEDFGVAAFTNDGDNHLTLSGTPSDPKTEQDVPAPLDPPDFTDAVAAPQALPGFRLLALYPNPAGEVAELHFALHLRTRLKIELTDGSGRLLRILENGDKAAGLYTLRTEVGDLPAGTYFYRISDGVNQTTQALLKQ